MAATTDQQMSLTVAPRGSSSHLNRPARQLVPAFLQKLYEMVNDPADQDLIRWSDTGDSFFVLDQERFASEVLGRWFKHKNFSSFVRQLNMYGFHKIPHLQQGVLRAESDMEFWNFEHPHFLRGQPDLLCLIQRKKQAPAGDDAHHAPAAGKDAGSAALGALSANQLVDINSIVNGIQGIKRHQAAISADLNELKSSNQHLWQEAMAARERHKKHQDTINRILKFLAGVFGHGENQMRKDEEPHAVVRKPPRLMIADGRDKATSEAEEAKASVENSRSTTSTNFFGTPTVQSSEPFPNPRFASVEPSVADAPTPTATDTGPGRAPPSEAASPLNSTTAPTPSQTNNDHIVQAALTSALNSPSQMQKLLAALAAQSISPEVLPPAGQAPHHPQHLIAPSPYNNNPQQYTPNVGQGEGNAQFNVSSPTRLPATYDPPANALSPFTLSLLGGPPDQTALALQEEEDRLQKSYRTAAEINNDVDELHSNIQSLIQSLGIDPSTLDSTTASADASTGTGTGTGSASADVDMFSSVPMGGGQDFDFDSFLMDMPAHDDDDGDLDKLAERLDPSAVDGKMGASTEQLHAFLDKVAPQDGSEGAGVLHGLRGLKGPVGGGAGAATGASAAVRGRKRKSEVMADGSAREPESAVTSTAGNKTKRKR